MGKYISILRLWIIIVASILAPFLITSTAFAESNLDACISTAKRGLLEVPDDRSLRFLGKVAEDVTVHRDFNSPYKKPYVRRKTLVKILHGRDNHLPQTDHYSR